jgi:hypothetical protein
MLLSMTTRHVKVRLSSGRDLTVPLTEDLTTKGLKEAIDAQTSNAWRLRIIFLGKILQDEQVIARVAPADAKEIVVQCSVTEGIQEQESTAETEVEAGEGSTAPAPRGFDRLREAGLSDEDIANLRAQFNREGGDEDAALSAEEAWIDNDGQDLNDGLTEALQGGSYEVLLGGAAGFFLGFAALLVIFEMDSIAGRRLPAAIVVGVCFNLIFGLCRE